MEDYLDLEFSAWRTNGFDFVIFFPLPSWILMLMNWKCLVFEKGMAVIKMMNHYELQWE